MEVPCQSFQWCLFLMVSLCRVFVPLFFEEWIGILRVSNVMNAQTRDLPPHLSGLQQNKRRDLESNLCPSANIWSQVQLNLITSPTQLDHKSNSTWSQVQLTTLAWQKYSSFLYLSKDMIQGSLGDNCREHFPYVPQITRFSIKNVQGPTFA